MTSNIGASLRQRNRDCLAEPGGRSSYQSYFSIKFELIENHNN